MTAIKNLRYDERAYEYRLIRDCLDGERAIKAQGQLYTKKPSGMDVTNYEHYLERGSFYGAPEMTLRALVGLALRKDPVVTLPTRLEPMRLNATHEKAPLSVLIEDTVREVMAMGRYGLLLDFAPDGNSAITTPYFSCWKAEEILDYQTAWIGGRKELVRVVLASDERWEDTDAFLELTLEDTVYKMRRFIVQGENKVRTDVGEEIIPTVGGRTLDHIPMVIVSHESLRPEDVKPPFLDLCTLAISHFRNSCDREHAIYLTAAPTPYVIGNIPEDKKPTTLGAGAMWVLPEGSEAGYLEFQGHGVGAQKDLMQEKVDMLATLGARMLSVNMNRNETIDTATQRTRSELALLHSVVVMVETAINRQLRRAAEWLNADASEAKVTLSRDFIETAMDPKAVEVQMRLWQSGAISRATLYENLQKGEIARADRSLDDEKDLIEEEGGDLSPALLRFPTQE